MKAPWQTMAAMVSSMGRLPWEMARKAEGWNGRNSDVPSHQLAISL